MQDTWNGWTAADVLDRTVPQQLQNGTFALFVEPTPEDTREQRTRCGNVHVSVQDTSYAWPGIVVHHRDGITTLSASSAEIKRYYALVREMAIQFARAQRITPAELGEPAEPALERRVYTSGGESFPAW